MGWLGRALQMTAAKTNSGHAAQNACQGKKLVLDKTAHTWAKFTELNTLENSIMCAAFRPRISHINSANKSIFAR